MDTRTRIISPEVACELVRSGRPVALVTGYFDGLQAADVRDIDRVRDSFPEAILLVGVVPQDPALFKPGARAEMAAALGMIDYVVSLDDTQMAVLVAALPAQRVIRLETAQQQRMRELTDHVKRRQTP